ncbi:MAG: beta-ribofuranosylaminobenzene 5'-phosphate synthase family protein [Haloarculaceae archaeon]
MTTVETGARLHFGFHNLALAHDRLYGGVGVALSEPRIVVEAEPAASVRCDEPAAEGYVRDAVDLLGVEGAEVRVPRCPRRHIGFGSGTQIALSCLVAVARAQGREVVAREYAPDLGRGGRSGVGVATFEDGGFVVDAGHPTEQFTSAPPERGDWDVPRPIARHRLPEAWRFVLVTPDVPTGKSGTPEEESIRAVVERAGPGIADEIATLLVRRLLPAVSEGDIGAFGDAVARLGRLNGAWYADEQGGVYRPPAGKLVDRLSDSPAVHGAGQSSWGPTVYGVTREPDLEAAVEAARRALAERGIDGEVQTATPRNDGASVVDE